VVSAGRAGLIREGAWHRSSIPLLRRGCSAWVEGH
jgi:hypothetical protein